MSLPELDDLTAEQLAIRCQSGCVDSFERLVGLHADRIFNYLCHLIRHRQDAEDLTQDTFLKAYRYIDNYRPEYPFATWLFTIAKRTACNHFRDRPPASSEVVDPRDEGVDERDPAVLAAQKDESASIWKLARALKPKQFEALWLRYDEGFSVAEIAGIMQTNRIYVKVLLHRARNELAKRLRRSR